jgi:hypothetical protein
MNTMSYQWDIPGEGYTVGLAGRKLWEKLLTKDDT